MLDKLKDLDLRYEDLESQLGDPRVYGDAEKLRQVNRELKELLPVVETYRAYQAADSRRREAEELLHDPEMKEMAQDELAEAKEELEQLKEKLAKEGLFDPAHKKPIPKYPHTIAIITSAAGAAIMDMLRILGKRYPLTKVKLLPVRVQGAEAPAEIAGAIRYANRYQIADLIITGRGGGSMEDLWAFNDERVARAIYDSEIPVISAVGHEPDVTIADYVADLRAATPSNAAELAVPDRQELQKKLQMMQASMQQSVQKSVKLGRQRLSALAEKRVLQSPLNYLEDRRVLLDFLSTRLQAAEQKTLHESKQRFVRLTAALDAMSPLKVLSRGYSMVTNEAGAVISRAADVRENETIRVSFSSGSLTARVEQIQEDAT